jgi:RNA polymerase sigma-70 factor (ECF subfamily)
MLRHVEGEALEQVAAACGCSLATVKRRIDAADTQIRRETGKEVG